MLNALTIDVEDYFQVHAFSNAIQYDDWCNYECRIEQNVDRILKILNEVKTQHPALSTQKVQGTFFVLGWIAERYPDLIRRIQKEGHEIACHGYAHQLIYNQSRDEFRQDIKRAKAILEDITGSEVVGYRAPSYSITNKSQWAFETLVEVGFRYDSSIFPIRHDFYGMPEAPRFPFLISLNGKNSYEFSVLNFDYSTLNTQNLKLESNNSLTHSLINPIAANSKLTTQHSKLITHNSKFIIEFPISTIRILGVNFPISGGGYFRLFPYTITQNALTRINEKEKKPFIFYIHPWEMDAGQPRIQGLKLKSRLRHYMNLDETESKFRRLLGNFQFSTIQQVLTQTS